MMKICDKQNAGPLTSRTKTHSDEMEGKWLQQWKLVGLVRPDRHDESVDRQTGRQTDWESDTEKSQNKDKIWIIIKLQFKLMEWKL